MANAKLYRINTTAVDSKPKYCASLKGQGKVVFDALKAETEPILAKELATKVSFPGSKQDPYRVTLYYIIIFKGKGLVTASEAEVEVEDEVSDEELEETITAS